MILKKKLIQFYLWGCFLSLVRSDVAINSSKLMEKSLPLYAIVVNSHILNDSSICRRELEILKEGIDNRVLWSLLILDTSGIPKPGFIAGNNYWLGVKSQCLEIGNRQHLEISPELAKEHSKYHNVDEVFPPFEINYFVARAKHNATIQYQTNRTLEDTINLGLCLPKSCTRKEVSQILSKIFKERTLLINNLYSIDLNLITVKNFENDNEWIHNWRSIIVWLVLIILLFMIIIGTGYELTFYQKRLNRYNNSKDESDAKEQYEPHKAEKIILSFSAYKNSKTIFDTKSSPKIIASIDGLKFFGLVLVFLAHLFVFSDDFVDNRVQIFRISSGLSTQIITNGSLYVDSFFFLSGFLISWSHFKQREKLKQQKNITSKFQWNVFFNRILRRIIRLTPVYMLIIGIAWMYYNWIMNMSPFDVIENPQKYCTTNWWQNLLYINNFFRFEEMCIPWSWYLANDMQYFIISQFLLLLSDIYFIVAAILSCGIIIGSIILYGYASYANNFSNTLDDLRLKINYIYTPMWIRIGPYIVGIITAYFLVQLKGKLNVQKKTLWVLWILGILCLFVALFGSTDKQIPLIAQAAYVASYRTLWTIGLGWLLVACYTNHGGPVNTFLSFKAWAPFSRMALSAYLLNPIVIHSIFLLTEFPAHYDMATYLVIGLGCAVLTFVFAFIITIIIESPGSNFFKNVFGI